MQSSGWRALGGPAAVAVGAAGLSVPVALAQWWFTNDVTEHLAVAHAWVEGRGFVDPVQWSYYRNAGVPFPSFALRAPAVSMLAAVPLALGASVGTVIALHAVFASVLAGALVAVARRFLREPAAIGAAILLCWSPAWIVLSAHVWNEVTAVAGFLAVLASAGGAARSLPRALRCSAATAFAWLCRPNLLALALAVVVAAASTLGPRRALRSRPLWAYAAGTAALVGAISLAYTAATGEAPYSRYAVMTEMLTIHDASFYAKEYVGAWAYIDTHAGHITLRMGQQLRELAHTLFLQRDYHGLGWLALVGVPFALWSRRRGAVERRSVALATLGFAVVAVATFTDFDRNRYPLFPALGAALCGGAALEALAEHGAARLTSRRWVAVCRASPLLVALAVFAATTAWQSIDQAVYFGGRGWRQGTREVAKPWDAPTRNLCPLMDRDALVAATNPWAIHLWCGNAGLVVPLDLGRPGLLARYLDEQHPGYLVVDQRREHRFLRHSPLVRHVITQGGFSLYEPVELRPGSRPWRAPPPLACAGKLPSCVPKRVGRAGRRGPAPR